MAYLSRDMVSEMARCLDDPLDLYAMAMTCRQWFEGVFVHLSSLLPPRTTNTVKDLQWLSLYRRLNYDPKDDIVVYVPHIFNMSTITTRKLGILFGSYDGIGEYVIPVTPHGINFIILRLTQSGIIDYMSLSMVRERHIESLLKCVNITRPTAAVIIDCSTGKTIWDNYSKSAWAWTGDPPSIGSYQSAELQMIEEMDAWNVCRGIQLYPKIDECH